MSSHPPAEPGGRENSNRRHDLIENAGGGGDLELDAGRAGVSSHKDGGGSRRNDHSREDMAAFSSVTRLPSDGLQAPAHRSLGVDASAGHHGFASLRPSRLEPPPQVVNSMDSISSSPGAGVSPQHSSNIGKTSPRVARNDFGRDPSTHPYARREPSQNVEALVSRPQSISNLRTESFKVRTESLRKLPSQRRIERDQDTLDNIVRRRSTSHVNISRTGSRVAPAEPDWDAHEDDSKPGFRKYGWFKRVLCCYFFGWYVPESEMPYIPYRNCIGWTTENSMRRKLIRLTSKWWWNYIFLVCNVIDNIILVSEYEMVFAGLARYTSLCFAGLYIVDVVLRTLAWGMVGGTHSLLAQSAFNKIDVAVTFACIWEIALSKGYFFAFTVRSAKMLRFFQPFTQFHAFAGLEAIMRTMEVGFFSLMTVVYLMLFCFVIFGVVGMEAYSGSFKRRCVWADTMEIKLPEQWCKRFDQAKFAQGFFATGNHTGKTIGGYGDPGRNNNCGPFQLCADVESPNLDFTKYDNMGASMLAIFQAFSNDGQAQVMWASIQSEPFYTPLTIIYYLSVAFVLGQLLINVFLAVLTTVFTAVRQSTTEEVKAAIEHERQMSLEHESSCESLSLNSHANLEQPDNAAHNAVKPETSEHIMQLVEEHMAEKGREKKQMNLPELFKLVFRSEPFGVFVLLMIIGNSVVIASIGLVDKTYSEEMYKVEYYFSMFFAAEFICQVITDGTLGKYLQHSEHYFDLSVQVLTSSALVAESVGASRENTSVLRSLAILRLLRGCKYWILRPLWLMFIKAVQSFGEISNLLIFIGFTMMVYTIIGMVVFGENLENPRANFSSFGRGILTLFQVFTGDGWTSVLYEGMYVSCIRGTEISGIEGDCRIGEALVYCAFYITFFWLGQFVFITMFLGVILENFSVDEFMVVDHVDHEEESRMINIEEARQVVASYQMIPAVAVSEHMLFDVYLQLGAAHSKGMLRKFLVTEQVKRVEPFRVWRFCKVSRLVYFRYLLRKYVCSCLANIKVLKAYPGDKDWEPPPEPVYDAYVPPPDEMIERYVANHKTQLILYMAQAEKIGIIGEIVQAAKTLGLEKDIPMNLKMTRPEVILQIVQTPRVSLLLKVDVDDIKQELEPPPVVERPPTLLERIAAECEKAAGVDIDIKDIMKLKTAMKSKTMKGSAVGGAVPATKLTKEDIEELENQYNLHKFFLTLSVSPIFDSMVYATIISSSIILCLETPAEEIPGPIPVNLFFPINVFFTLVFLLEAISKIAAYGFLVRKNDQFPAYWSSGWNRVDLLVLILTLAEMTGLSAYLGTDVLRIFRMLRALKPLRLMNRNPGMKLIVAALLGCAKPITYAVVFLFIVTTVFAVVGVAMFRDTFGYCNDASWVDGSLGEGFIQCVGNSFTKGAIHDGGVFYPRAWLNPRQNFDSYPSAVLTLCMVFTLQWVSVWYSAQDSVAADVQPIANHSTYAASFYLIAFIFAGSFLSLNLFISFIVDGFYSSQGVDTKYDDIQYATVQKMILSHWPRFGLEPPKRYINLLARKLTKSQRFKTCTAFLLIGNIVCMTLKFEGQGEALTYFLSIQNTLFFGVMCLEAFLELLAWGWRIYVSEWGNWFDMTLILTTAAIMASNSEFERVSQIIRILRLIKFVHGLSSNKLITAVFDTVALSGPQVANILIVLFLAMTVFAVIGISSFGTTRTGVRLGSTANFRNYPMAMMTLFQIIFGDDGMGILDDCSISYPSCTKSFHDPVSGQKLSYGDCGSVFAPVFFISYTIVAQCTLMNLFVGMVINNFFYCSNKETLVSLKNSHLDELTAQWENILKGELGGATSSCFISYQYVYTLMWTTHEPFGFLDCKYSSARYLCVRQDLLNLIKIDIIRKNGLAMHVSLASVPARTGPVMKLVDWLRKKESYYVEQCQFEYDANVREFLMSKGDEGAIMRMDQRNENNEKLIAAILSGDMVKVSDDKAAIARLEAEPEEDWLFETREYRLKKRSFLNDHPSWDSEEYDEQHGGSQKGDNDFEEIGASEGNSVQKNGEEGEENVHTVSGQSFGSKSVWVSGGNMGPKKVALKKKATKKTGYSIAEDIDEDGNRTYVTKKQAAINEKNRAETTRVDPNLKGSIKKMGKRQVTIGEMFWRVLRMFFQLLLLKQDRLERPPGQSRYDEVANALLYWNKINGNTPTKVMERRSQYDDEIQATVAAQIIQAWYRGKKCRLELQKVKDRRAEVWKRRGLEKRAKMMSEQVTAQTQEDEAELDVLPEKALELLLQGLTLEQVKERLAEEQRADEEKAEEERVMIEEFHAFLNNKIMGDESMTEDFLLKCVHELGLHPPRKGRNFMSLPVETLLAVHHHPEFMRLKSRIHQPYEHSRAQLIIDRMVDAGFDRTLRIIADGKGMDIYSIEHMTELTMNEALLLVRDPTTRTIYKGQVGFDDPILHQNEDVHDDSSNTMLISEDFGHPSGSFPRGSKVIGRRQDDVGADGHGGRHSNQHLSKAEQGVVSLLIAQRDELTDVLKETQTRLQKEKAINENIAIELASERQRLRLEMEAERRRFVEERAQAASDLETRAAEVMLALSHGYAHHSPVRNFRSDGPIDEEMDPKVEPPSPGQVGRQVYNPQQAHNNVLPGSSDYVDAMNEEAELGIAGAALIASEVTRPQPKLTRPGTARMIACIRRASMQGRGASVGVRPSTANSHVRTHPSPTSDTARPSTANDQHAISYTAHARRSSSSTGAGVTQQIGQLEMRRPSTASEQLRSNRRMSLPVGHGTANSMREVYSPPTGPDGGGGVPSWAVQGSFKKSQGILGGSFNQLMGVLPPEELALLNSDKALSRPMTPSVSKFSDTQSEAIQRLIARGGAGDPSWRPGSVISSDTYGKSPDVQMRRTSISRPMSAMSLFRPPSAVSQDILRPGIELFDDGDQCPADDGFVFEDRAGSPVAQSPRSPTMEEQMMQSPAKIRDAILIKENEIMRLQKSFSEAKHKKSYVPHIETHEEHMAKLHKKEMLRVRRESAFEPMPTREALGLVIEEPRKRRASMVVDGVKPTPTWL